jgi:hypothetical protein
VARFSDRQPQIRIVNSIGLVTAGPYRLDVASSAPATYGLTLERVEPTEQVEAVVFKNFQWDEVGYPFGYRLGVMLSFVAVEGAPGNSNYGLTLLHNLWRLGIENQFSYAALQFAMFSGSSFYPMLPSPEWNPTTTAGKQGFFDVSISLQSRSLVANPGNWADSQW